MSTYRSLLRVTVRHSYNAGGICSCIGFVPSARTERLFSNLGLVCRNTGGGILIACDMDRLEALEQFVAEPMDAASFEFRALASDPQFRQYSEPYADADGEIPCFDNRAADRSGDRDLTAGATVSRRDLVAFDADELAGILIPRDRLLPPAFVLRIFTGEAGSSLRQWLESAPRAYRISFASRQRYWKYFLLGRVVREAASARDFAVVDADGAIEFETAGEERLGERRRAFTFRSKQRLPLSETYSYRFQLRRSGQAGENVVVSELPHASVGRVGFDRVAEQDAIVSEIYFNS